MRRDGRTRRARPALEPLEPRDQPATVGGRLPAAGVTAWHPVTADAAGVLSAAADGEGLRLTLARADGTVLLTSAGAAGRIDLHVAAGAYQLGVSAARPDTPYTLTSDLTEAVSPLAPLAAGDTPKGVAAGDLNGDAWPDMVAVNRTAKTVSVWLGAGAGTFLPRRDLAVASGLRPVAVVIADADADGLMDIVTANAGADGAVSVFLNDGQDPGSFPDRLDVPVGGNPAAVAVGDLNGDGLPDIATANGADNAVAVLLGAGGGGFSAAVHVPTVDQPSAVAIADVTGDGRADLVWTTFEVGTVRILPGAAAGPFDPTRPQTEYAVGLAPTALAVADLDRDGDLDVVTANRFGNSATVLLGSPAGGLTRRPDVTVGVEPAALTLADADGDGVPDLIVANGNDAMNVFLGAGDGSFGPARELAAGADLTAVAAADFNQDGAADVVSANGGADQLRVAFGNGDGTFLSAGAFLVGREPASVALGDLDGDGVLDAVTANAAADTVGVALGNGDGTFGARRAFAAGSGPVSVALADFNGDGRPDVVAANRDADTVSVLFGLGDGSLTPMGTYRVGDGPQAVVAADLDGDGAPDFVSADAEADTLTVWWGVGDGTFAAPTTVPAGDEPIAVAVADVNGDGRTDVVAANKLAKTVGVHFTASRRTFTPAVELPTGAGPVSVAVADLDADGRPDVVAGTLGKTLAVFAGQSDGTFERRPDVPAGADPFGLIVADVNADGRADLAGTDISAGTLNVSLGAGDGAFLNPMTFPVGERPIFLAAGDLNADGRPDLVAANSAESTLGVLLGPFTDSASPTTADPRTAVPPRHTPVLADLDGDGLTDSVIRDRAGAILFRKGQADPRQPFAAPRRLNELADPARDVAVYETGGGRRAVAAIDLKPDATRSTPGRPVYRVSTYAFDADGVVGRDLAVTSDLLPTGLAAGDLDGSGRDALVLTHALDGRVTVARPGRFGSPAVLRAGDNPTGVVFTDTDGDGRRDIVVSASVSGDATVLHNDAGTFTAAGDRYRLGDDLSGVDAAGAVLSRRQPVGVAAGTFFAGGGPGDLVALLQGSHELAVLKADGHGGYLNPSDDWVTPTSRGRAVSDQPGSLVSGFFDGDAVSDVAFVERGAGEVWVYRGRGDGTFAFVDAVPVGDAPAGLTARRNPATGRTDLYVGNPAGDVLRLAGKGDGTFEPPPPLTGAQTSLAVAADGRVLVVNQKTAEASVQVVSAAGKAKKQTTLAPPAADTQQAPRDGLWANLNGGSSPDLVVVGTGSNDVVVYRALGPDAAGRPAFAAPVRYAVGTNPVSATAGDVNGDGVQDLLVTNQGSNDVSVLFGSLTAGAWTATPGPRLKSGGVAPVATTLRDTDGDGRPELIVTNRLSAPGAAGGSLVTMADRGFGFFDDARAAVAPQAAPLVSPPVFPTGPGAGVYRTPDGNLFGIDGRTFAPLGRVFDGGGVRQFDALADGRLLAYRNGGVDVLSADAAGQYQTDLTLAPLTGIPSEPTALAVLESDNGFRALVATAGSSQMFVFDVPAADGAGVDGLPADSPVISLPTALSRDALAVVVTLLAGGLPGDGSRDDEGGESDVAFLSPAADDDSFGVQVGETEEEAADPVTPDGERRPPSEEAQRELDGARLYQPEEPIDPDEDPAEEPAEKTGDVESAWREEEESVRESPRPAEVAPVVAGAKSGVTVSNSDPFAAALWLTFFLILLAKPAVAESRPRLFPAA